MEKLARDLRLGDAVYDDSRGAVRHVMALALGDTGHILVHYHEDLDLLAVTPYAPSERVLVLELERRLPA